MRTEKLGIRSEARVACGRKPRLRSRQRSRRGRDGVGRLTGGLFQWSHVLYRRDSHGTLADFALDKLISELEVDRRLPPAPGEAVAGEFLLAYDRTQSSANPLINKRFAASKAAF